MRLLVAHVVRFFPEFLALRRGLMSLIREESLKAMGGEITDLGMQGLNIELQGHSLADVL